MLHRQCGGMCGELTSDFESERVVNVGGDFLNASGVAGLAAAVFGVLAYSLECRITMSRGDGSNIGRLANSGFESVNSLSHSDLVLVRCKNAIICHKCFKSIAVRPATMAAFSRGHAGRFSFSLEP